MRNNIAYGRPEAEEADIIQAAQAAFAWDFIQNLPKGLDTVIGEQGVMLSGGERQRVAIARALLKDPPILILDEATSALDSESEREVQKALDNLIQGRTTLVIAHRLSTIRHADRIVVLDDGRIVEEGRHEDLLARGGVYANLYYLQFRPGEEEVYPGGPGNSGHRPGVNFMSFRWHTTFQTLLEEPGAPAPGLALRTAATAFSWLYGLGARGRRSLYDLGCLQIKRLPCPVLSIGNLVVGGVGKTPLTAWLAQRFQAAGCRVAIVSRGYGGKAQGINVVTDGHQIFLKPPQAGDEAYLLALKLKGIPLVTGVDRYQAGLKAWEAFQPDLILLDDGFQHFQLYRDLDVVLLDAASPFGNGRLLPRGSLREPVSTLQRPLVLVLTRYEADRHQSTWEAVLAAFPAAEVLRAAFQLSHAVKYPGSQEVDLEALSGVSLIGFAGLARPEVFAASLRQAGIAIKQFFPFLDHHHFAAGELTWLVAAAQRLGAEGLVTTEKDWVRLSGDWTAALPLYVVPLKVDLLDPWPEGMLPLGCARKLSAS